MNKVEQRMSDKQPINNIDYKEYYMAYMAFYYPHMISSEDMKWVKERQKDKDFMRAKKSKNLKVSKNSKDSK